MTQETLTLKVTEKRGWDIVPIWVERFALPVLGTTIVGLVIFNVLKMDWIQKTGIALGIFGLSLFLAQTLHLYNQAKADTNTTQEGEQKKPDVQQSSQGTNSPNTVIIGSNNTVINSTDPKVLARLDEIKKLVQKQQGDRATPDKLLQKYPLGYVIFDIDQKSSVFPYAADSLQWEFDWSTVRLTEDVQRKILWLTLPNVTHKGASHPMLSNNQVGGQKKLGQFDGIILSDGTMRMMAEILAIRPQGIVFLIGFDHDPKNK